MAIGFEKYQENMRENVEKENSRRFPAQLWALGCQSTIAFERQGRKEKSKNKQNKIQKQNINILI